MDVATAELHVYRWEQQQLTQLSTKVRGLLHHSQMRGNKRSSAAVTADDVAAAGVTAAALAWHALLLLASAQTQ